MKSTYKTKAREMIIAYLKEHPEQRLTAREIYEAVCSGNVEVDRTTVYRNLDRLCESGELMRFKEPNRDAWYYQYSAEHEHCDRHMHAQCSLCGKIFHLDKPFVDVFAAEMLKEYGLEIDPSETIILGKCSKCRRIKKR
ncbi:MAG: transcriptional repressor [Butyrivibrio sp.]|uniref:Fur family transcriptional regulator n=1 Tax=Butyrivibrio sp. TaxID=28121 RepID=UPI001B0B6E46|nr:transcriptional repressor [Butyrivibrio sp.]MBO6240879.1 transcriptional repressor [Butyrivibrio sp.]